MRADDSGRDEEPQEQLRAAVESIGGHARAVNRDRAARLERAVADAAVGSLGESARRRAAEVAHQLVGSAGTFGFAAASELAAELERYFTEADPDDPARLAAAREQVRRLAEALAAEPDYQPEDERDPTG